MHWFDRLSRQLAAAPEVQVTRRQVLKGVGAAAVAAPLASHTAAYAKNSIKARPAFDLCTSCLLGAYKEYVTDNRNTKRFFASLGKGKKAKLTPVQSAALQSYLAANRRFLIEDLNKCRTGAACVTGPAPPGTTVTGSTFCPPGTAPCPGDGGVIAICCFGGDACCPCGNANGGYICCASVIGCTCC